MAITVLDGPSGPTTVYHIKSRQSNGPLVVLIPGNPGVAEYYTAYLDELHKQLPQAELICVAHLGCNTFGPQGGFEDRVYSLDEQVQHKVELVKQLTAHSNRTVVIMGHSVGAWMTQRMVVKLLNDDKFSGQIRFVGLITPTMHDIAESSKGRLLTGLVRYVTKRPGYVLARACQLLYRTLPSRILTTLVDLGLGRNAPAHAVSATLAMVSRPSIVLQAGDMGAEEMLRIGGIDDTDSISNVVDFWDDHGYNIWGYFAAGDPWISLATRRQLIVRYGSLAHVNFEVIYDGIDTDPIKHSFCVRHSERFAQITGEAISASVLGLE